MAEAKAKTEVLCAKDGAGEIFAAVLRDILHFHLPSLTIKFSGHDSEHDNIDWFPREKVLHTCTYFILFIRLYIFHKYMYINY